jgi:dual specificity phosphatase 12
VLDESDLTKGRLFLSGQSAARNKDFIREAQIKAVITSAMGVEIKFDWDSTIFHKIFLMDDDEEFNIEPFFPETFDIIEENLKKTNVLVHCGGGISRSATIVMAYLMRSQRWPFEKTLKYVRSKRPMIMPNWGFEKQLMKYQKKLGIPHESRQQPVPPENSKEDAV